MRRESIIPKMVGGESAMLIKREELIFTLVDVKISKDSYSNVKVTYCSFFVHYKKEHL